MKLLKLFDILCGPLVGDEDPRVLLLCLLGAAVSVGAIVFGIRLFAIFVKHALEAGWI